ncbi:MAG: YfhO family protein, partial [Bacteroidetes bacterium]|nr:YfhO family protein [Bacteroidota bacterium]
AVLLALGTTYSVNNVILWDAGHASKVRTLALLSWVIAGVLLLYYRRKMYLGAAVLGLGLALSVYAQHAQMIYYAFMVFVFLGVIFFIQAIRQQAFRSFFTATGIVFVLAILAVGSSASRIWSVYDFNQSTMRGAPILEQNENADDREATSSSEVEGLEWSYAMQWSNTAVDLMATYIPGLAGGSGAEKLSKDSELYKKYRIPQGPLYWGGLPFTAGPNYLGAVFWFLFLFGLLYTRGPIRIWLGLAVLLTLVVSMGRHVEWFNRLLFEYLPLYNKFRTPQSILSVTVFFLPLLGGLGLYRLVKNRESVSKKNRAAYESRFRKALFMSGGIALGIALLFALLPGIFLSFEGAGDANYIQQGIDVNALIGDRRDLATGDAWRTFFFVLFSAGALWFFGKGKLKSPLLLLGIIGLLAFADNWGVSKRYVAHEDFVSARKHNQNFQARPVDQTIMNAEENRYDYRVLDLSVNTFNTTFPSTFHNHIGGYHPAKLQRYQDMIDYHIRSNNQQVLNMLNTKYFIVPDQQGGGERVQRNPGALGHAWAVDEIIPVDRPKAEIEALRSFRPEDQAVILESEFAQQLKDFEVQRARDTRITLKKYHPEKLTYSFSSSRDQLIVFSEIWYGPDKGWQAYIDGQPVPHMRANYILRALKVPAGQHEIVFEFRPESYYQGEKIALGFSIIMLLIILGGFYKGVMENGQGNA